MSEENYAEMSRELDYPTAGLAQHWHSQPANSHKYSCALAEYLDTNLEFVEDEFGDTDSSTGYIHLFAFHDEQRIGDNMANADYACILRTTSDGFVSIHVDGDAADVLKQFDTLSDSYYGETEEEEEEEDEHVMGADE